MPSDAISLATATAMIKQALDPLEARIVKLEAHAAVTAARLASLEAKVAERDAAEAFAAIGDRSAVLVEYAALSL